MKSMARRKRGERRLKAETPDEIWAMSLGAVYVEENQMLAQLVSFSGEPDEDPGFIEANREDIELGVTEGFCRIDMNVAEEDAGACRDMLADMWDVTDKKSALGVVSFLREQGLRREYETLVAILKDGSRSVEESVRLYRGGLEGTTRSGLEPGVAANLVRIVTITAKNLGAAGILGWDLARLVHLLRMSFIAGHIDDATAWAELATLASFRPEFTHWSGFHQSFLAGRQFWSGARDPGLEECGERLLTHPYSPWVRFPWAGVQT